MISKITQHRLFKLLFVITLSIGIYDSASAQAVERLNAVGDQILPVVTGVTATGAVSVSPVVETSKLLHFVTPKSETTDVVTLTATIEPNTPEIRENIEWEGATENPLNPLQATRLKNQADRYPVRIKYGTTVLKELRVWVVWATITPAQAIGMEKLVWPDSALVASHYMFTTQITPATILTGPADDRPNLRGNKKESNLPPSVSGTETGVYALGIDLKSGAVRKWDDSQQIRIKLINLDNIDFESPNYYGKDVYSTVLMWKSYPDWPNDEIVGNDDAVAGEEGYTLLNSKGEIISLDQPKLEISHVDGNVGDTVEVRRHFRRFTRLELNGTWVRISNYINWRQHAKFRKVSEVIADEDYNNNGNKLDNVWIDNGSTDGLNHDGW